MSFSDWLFGKQSTSPSRVFDKVRSESHKVPTAAATVSERPEVALRDVHQASETFSTKRAAPTGVETREHAEREVRRGKACLARPLFPGAGALAIDEAADHFTRAAALDPSNSEYAMNVGVARQLGIERFLLPWGKGPLLTIAAFTRKCSLGKAINSASGVFDFLPLSSDNHGRLLQLANDVLKWYERATTLDPENIPARCRRAQFLRDIGAFKLALEEVDTILAASNASEENRGTARKIAEYITDPESELRKFLTVQEAKNMDPPKGIDL